MVKLCGLPGACLKKGDILCPFYVPFTLPCPGQKLNIVEGVREVKGDSYDIVWLPGACQKKRDILCPFYVSFTLPCLGQELNGVRGVSEFKGDCCDVVWLPRALQKRRDIMCPFQTTLPWARIKWCGRSQRGER